MANEIAGVLRKALVQLSAQRAELDRQISAIQAALGALGSPDRADGTRGRRAMSAAARRAVGKRMKAYWAKRRAAKAKPAKKAE
jgi:hypothetical protein